MMAEKSAYMGDGGYLSGYMGANDSSSGHHHTNQKERKTTQTAISVGTDVCYDQPATFVAPEFGESSSQPLFFDYFPANQKIGEKWMKSSAEKYAGVLAIEAPKTVTIEGDLGLVVKTKARHHAISAKLDKPFNFDKSSDKLVVQYDVKYEEGQECGGGYLKLLSEGSQLQESMFSRFAPINLATWDHRKGGTDKLIF